MTNKNILAEIDRRNLFRYLGNAAIFAPFMRTLLETEAFGATNAKRSLFFFYPDGMVPEQFHPTTLGTGFDLKTITKPLEAVRDDIVMITKSNYTTMGSHEAGAGYCLTGVANRAPALSIDTYLGNKLKAGVSLPVLRLGIGSSFQTGSDKAVSFATPGVPSPIEDNPKRAFAAIFGSAPSTPGSPPSGPRTLGAKGQKSVLDSNLADLKTLQTRLGTIEKVKLDLHVESVRELERRTQIMIDSESGGTSSETSASCNRAIDFRGFDIPDNESSYPPVVLKNENYNRVCDIQIDIAVQALACGITNVVLFQMSHAVSPLTMDFPGGPSLARSHHEISHYGNNGNEHAVCQAYFISKYAKILSGMKAIKEGDKNLLFNALTLAVTEIGHADYHSLSDVGIIMGGQAGGMIKTGRAIDAKGASHGQTLVSILQAMGLQESKFGEASGVMPNLLG